MKKLFLPALVFTVTYFAHSQNAIYYNFTNGNLKADTSIASDGPNLIPVGTGGFVSDNTPLGTFPTYGFDQYAGLKFDNSVASNFLGESHSVEMYYKLTYTTVGPKRLLTYHADSDSGLYHYSYLRFYPFTAGAATLNSDEYVHVVLTRDINTQVKVFSNGVKQVEFFDANGTATLDADNELLIFKDNILGANQGEEAAGNVVYLGLFDFTLTEQQVATLYADLTSTSIFEVKGNSNFNIYPNPAANTLHISSSEFQNDFDVVLKDLTGKKVLEITHQNTNDGINIDYLDKGIYLMQITDGKRTGVRKLIKQ
ncbi:MAG: T9SS type A sorting domain-containing protein [Chitinophagales bacterium]|jgi:hypothetical protein|nr:T9SS type A sorting domain-containing protein [Chitinophagales bacterium]